MKKHFLKGLSFAAVLLLSACHTENNKIETEKINGKVADGYLQNALICLDQNDNMKCDNDEPSTTSDENGEYNLTINKKDKGKYHILVEVNKDSVDLDDNLTIDKEYTLLAPLNQYSFISPLTTIASISYKYFPDDMTLEDINKNLNLFSYDKNTLYQNYIENEDNNSHQLAKGMANIFKNNLEIVKNNFPNLSKEEQILTAYFPLMNVDNEVYSLNNNIVSNFYIRNKLLLESSYTDVMNKELYFSDISDNEIDLYKLNITNNYIENTSNEGFISINDSTNADNVFENDSFSSKKYVDMENDINNKLILKYKTIHSSYCNYDKFQWILKQASLEGYTYKPIYSEYEFQFGKDDEIYFLYSKQLVPTYKELAETLDINESACIIENNITAMDIPELIEKNEIDEYTFYPIDEKNGIAVNRWDVNYTYKIINVDDEDYLVIRGEFYKLKNNNLYEIYFDTTSNGYRIEEYFNKNAINTIFEQLNKKEAITINEIIGVKLYNEIGNYQYIFNENNFTTIAPRSNVYAYPAKIENGEYSWEIKGQCSYQEVWQIKQILRRNLNNKYIYSTWLSYEDIKNGYNPDSIKKLTDENHLYNILQTRQKSDIEEVIKYLNDNNCTYQEINKTTIKEVVENNISFNFIYEDDWKNGHIQTCCGEQEYTVITINGTDYLILKSVWSAVRDEIFKVKEEDNKYMLQKVDFDYEEKNETNILYDFNSRI